MGKRYIFLFGILPFVLFFAAVFYSCQNSGGFGGDGAGSFRIIKTVESPDGNNAAIFWDAMGGGAAGWCRKYVNITDKSEVFDINNVEENRKNAVFDVKCDSETEMIWKSTDELKIFCTPETDGRRLKTSFTAKQVKISYEVK